MKTLIAALLLMASPALANRAVMENLAASNNAIFIGTTTPAVGINTVTPAATLDVNGSAQFGSGATKSTFSATGALTLSGPAVFGGVSPWADVKAFGALGNDAHDDTAAINAACAVLPSSGGVAFFPPGVYLTTGLSVTTRCTLQGAGCQGYINGSTGTAVNCASVIHSVTNAPIVKFANNNPGGTAQNRHILGLVSIGVAGSEGDNFSNFNNQHCVQVDNGGISANDISLTNCKGHGLYLTDSTEGRFYNLAISHANGDGINCDDSAGTPTKACNDNQFFGGHATENGRSGFRIDANGWGTVVYGFTFEANTGYGIDLNGDNNTGANLTRFTHFRDIWDESNTAGSIHFGTNTQDTETYYTRYSSGVIRDTIASRNLVSGSNVNSVTGALEQDAPYMQFHRVRSGGGFSPSDEDTLRVRNYLGTADGVVSAKNYVATAGLPDAILISTGVPVTGAFNVANGQGIRTQNAANNGSYSLINGDVANGTNMGQGSTGTVTITGNTLLTGTVIIKSSDVAISYGLVISSANNSHLEEFDSKNGGILLLEGKGAGNSVIWLRNINAVGGSRGSIQQFSSGTLVGQWDSASNSVFQMRSGGYGGGNFGIGVTSTTFDNAQLVVNGNAIIGFSGSASTISVSGDWIGATNSSITLSGAGYMGFASRTIAQLLASTPTASFQTYGCSNCSPVKLVISTGTSLGNFADAVGGTFK